MDAKRLDVRPATTVAARERRVAWTACVLSWHMCDIRQHRPQGIRQFVSLLYGVTDAKR